MENINPREGNHGDLSEEIARLEDILQKKKEMLARYDVFMKDFQELRVIINGLYNKAEYLSRMAKTQEEWFANSERITSIYNKVTTLEDELAQVVRNIELIQEEFNQLDKEENLLD